MKWIQWIFDHIWTVIIVGTVLVQLLQAITKKKGGADEAPPPHEEETFEDPDLAERTRRIREEIQRKIAERAQGYPTEQPASPQVEDAEPPLVREVFVPPVPSVLQPSSSRLEAQRRAEILEEQATLAERLREAEGMKAAALRRVRYETSTKDQSMAARNLSRSATLGDLHDPATLRRAFILREVLGPPVALR